MASTITLDGVRMNRFKRFVKNIGFKRDGVGDVYMSFPGGYRKTTGPRLLGDAWSDDQAAPPGAGTAFAADFTTSAVGWGVLAFAIATAALRAKRAISG
jgi:hypothetical protein